jgi:hypothetical protein
MLLDLQTPEMTDSFSRAPLYRKNAVVRIRPATPGEVIQTVLADGTVETSNTAREGHYVITNPGGEQYLKGAAKVAAQYIEIGDGLYRANAYCRAFPNPVGSSIKIIAPWGEEQIGAPDCMLVARYYLDQPDDVNTERFIIGAKEFAETYEPMK